MTFCCGDDACQLPDTHPCTECGTVYTSPRAAAACAHQDRTEDRDTRR